MMALIDTLRELKDTVVDLFRRVEDLERYRQWDNFEIAGGDAAADVTIPVDNQSGEAAPEGAWIEVYDHDGAYYQFTKPTGDNLDNVYILVSELAAGGKGLAWDRGITGPAYMQAAPSAGDILGSVNGQWYGQVSDDGTHVAVADEYVVL